MSCLFSRLIRRGVPAMEGIITSFTTAVTAMGTNVMSMISAAVPVALPIAAAGLAIRIGWRVTKSLTN